MNHESTNQAFATLREPRYSRWLSTVWAWRLLPVSILVTALGYFLADNAFRLARFPAGLFEWQLAFSADKTQTWYAILQAQGTLHFFVEQQWLDFIFIFGTMSTLFLVNLLLGRMHPLGSFWNRVGIIIALVAPLLDFTDALENVTYFAMWRDIAHIPQALAVLSSSLSLIKWLSAGIGAIALLIQVGALLITRQRAFRTIPSSASAHK